MGVSVPTEDFAVLCLHNLLAVDTTAILKEETNLQGLQDLSLNNTKKLLVKIFDLPKELSDEGNLAILPLRPEFPLPRLKKIPAIQPQTRWDKFAQDRNITKRKRSRLVWNDTQKDWAPRWGADSGKNKKRKAEEAIIEMKPGEDIKTVVENRRSGSKLEKKKQEFRELRNKVEGMGGKLSSFGSPGIGTIEMGNKKTKSVINEMKKRTALSTASFGVYNKPIQPPQLDKTKKKKKKFA